MSDGPAVDQYSTKMLSQYEYDRADECDRALHELLLPDENDLLLLLPDTYERGPEHLLDDPGPEISPVLELTKLHSELTNCERVHKSTKVIGDITYVPRHIVFNAMRGKPPSQLGLDTPTIVTLLTQAGFADHTVKKDGTLRSSGALRTLLRKHLKSVFFWCSHPAVQKKRVERAPGGRHRLAKQMVPEPRETWFPEWERDVHPEYRQARSEGIFIR